MPRRVPREFEVAGLPSGDYAVWAMVGDTVHELQPARADGLTVVVDRDRDDLQLRPSARK